MSCLDSSCLLLYFDHLSFFCDRHTWRAIYSIPLSDSCWLTWHAVSSACIAICIAPYRAAWVRMIYGYIYIDILMQCKSFLFFFLLLLVCFRSRERCLSLSCEANFAFLYSKSFIVSLWIMSVFVLISTEIIFCN